MDRRRSATPGRFSPANTATCWRSRIAAAKPSRSRSRPIATPTARPTSWQPTAARGIKIRTRALATTLFARLVLSDLFLHGIGGAKYDQVTDDIARRFFGFSLPEFATASATLRLPIVRPAVTHDSIREVRQRAPRADLSSGTIPGHQRRRGRGSRPRKGSLGRNRQDSSKQPRPPPGHRRRQSCPSKCLLRRSRDALQRRRNDLEHRLAVDSILNSRDYSFCLFPREHFAVS